MAIFLHIFLGTFILKLLVAVPVPDNSENVTNSSSNTTTHDLFVIRTVVYELGILTDADNDTDASNETHERLDLTFYDPERNGSAIDLSHIPFPVQTNVSGQVITGIAPANLGIFSLMKNLTELRRVLLPNALISHSANISISDPQQQERVLENLPAELGF